jgi:MFS family permease
MQKPNNTFSYLMCGIASMFLLYEFVLQISPSMMVHDWMAYFKADAMTIGIASAFFYYAYTPSQLLGGFLYDRLGARLTLTFATIACATGALCIVLAHSIFLVAAGRFLMGTGAAFAFVGVLFVGSQWLPARYFASVASFTELMGCLGAVLAEAPLASAVNHFGWKPVILALVVSGYVLAIIYSVVIKDRPTQTTKTYSFKTVFKNKQLWAIGLYALFIFAPISIFAGLWGVPFLQTKFNVSTVEAGQACSMIWIGMALGSIVLGILSDALAIRKWPLMLSSLLGILISSCLIYSSLSFSNLYWLLFLLGASTSGQALSFAVVKDNVGSHDVGLAMGFNNMLAASSGALFQPLVGYLLRLTWDGKILNQIPIYTLDQYQTALIILPICYACSALVCRYFIREPYANSVNTLRSENTPTYFTEMTE